MISGEGKRALLGAVLAGGASRRYGRPKWRVPVAGVPMARWAVEALEPLARRVGVVGSDPALESVLGVERRPDRVPDAGPLGGLHAALRWADDEGLDGVLLLACDLPLVGPEALAVLAEAWGGEDAVVPWDDQGPEPVCALYARTILPAVESALARGGGALHALVASLKARAVPVDELRRAQGRRDVLLNVNTPEERMRAEALLHPGPPLVCVVGYKDSGKTGLTVALAAELASRGRRVMTVKHGHGFDLDTRGTDSWRHREEGGAERVMLVGPEELALVGGWGPEGERPLRELVDRHLAEAGIVVAEGWKDGPDPKVEVYRAAAHTEPVHDPGSPTADTYLATVTDRPDYRPGHPVFPLHDPAHVRRVADRVQEILLA